MTVKELKEKLNEYPDDMEVGGRGFYGQVLKLSNIELGDDHFNNLKEEFVHLLIQGEEYPFTL